MRLNWSTNFATSNGFNAFDAYIRDYFSGYQKNSDYYHGDDFTLKLYYKVGNLTCTLDATGVRGPVITATRLDGTSGRFNLRANVTTSTAWYRSVREVHFTVYRNGVVMHHEVDTSAPYCLFGRDAASCPTNLAGYVWNKGTLRTDDDVRIDPGNYVIYIVGADTGFSLTNNNKNFTGSYATRIRYDLNLVSSLPTPVTPTVAPPTATTRAPTSTSVLPTATTRVPTSTTVAPITLTPSNTPNYTKTPTATATPTPTRTPRPTQCSPEDPGCIPPTPTP
jgi:hypothetical protein